MPELTKKPASANSDTSGGKMKRPAAAGGMIKRPAAARSRSPRMVAKPTAVLDRLKAFVVNLDRRPDRWVNFQKMAQKEIPWLDMERFPASDGSKTEIPEAEVARVWRTNCNAWYGDYSEWTFDAPGSPLDGVQWKWACDADTDDKQWKFTDNGDDTGKLSASWVQLCTLAVPAMTEAEVTKMCTQDSWNIRKTDKRYKDGVQLKMSNGERGCASSHRRLWSVAAERTEPTLVLEDDVKLCSPLLRPNGRSNGKKFAARLTMALQKAPADFDVLYLGWAGHRAGNLKHLNESQFEDDASIMNVLRRVEYVWTTVAYVISQNGARKLLAAAAPMNQPVDNFMAWEAREGRLKSYVVLGEGDDDDVWNGGIVDQLDFQGDSDIQKSDGGEQGDDIKDFAVRASDAGA